MSWLALLSTTVEIKPNWIKIELHCTIRSSTEFSRYFEKYKYDVINQNMSIFATKSHHFSPVYGKTVVEWLNCLTEEEIDTDIERSTKLYPS